MATRFQAVATAPAVPFGVGRTIRQQDLPNFYAWASAHLLPEFDRQLNIGSAAETLWFLTQIWPIDTGLSVNSWEAGVNTAPTANSAPGPRPTTSQEQYAQQLDGVVRQGDEIVIANHARRGKAVGSYAELLWDGYSRQMPAGAEKPLTAHLQRQQDTIVKRAEDRTVRGAF